MDAIETRTAVEELFSQIGKVTWSDDTKPARTERTLSAILDLGDMKRQMCSEFVSNASPKVINEFAGRFINTNERDVLNILVAPYFSERGLKLCKDKGIACLDLCGNAYIRTAGLLIDRQGRENRFKVMRKQVNLFSTKSAWVVRSLLTAPGKGWTMKELANASKVSLAQAFKVTESLQEEGFLNKARGNIRLIDASGLLDAWASAYRYEGNDFVGFYSPFKDRSEMFEGLRNCSECRYALTMGSGASLVAPAVRSTDAYMYTLDIDRIKEILGLVPMEFGGNVYVSVPKDGSVLRGTRTIDGLRVVSDLQLYLDLFKYPQRGREQSDEIRSRVLRF